MRRSGYTLLEVSMSMALLSVISLLSFVVLRSSTEAAALAQAKNEMQSNLRDVMTALTSELREAYTERAVNAAPPIAPEDVEAVAISEDAMEIVFHVPRPTGDPNFVTGSPPITIRWENEDGGSEPNARLDQGEDENGDGILTRRLVRTEGGAVTVLAAANDVSGVRFALVPNRSTGDNTPTSLFIRLESSKRYGHGAGKMVRGELEATIDLAN